MSIDFERGFGVNSGYVESIYHKWRESPEEIDPEWRTWFERLTNIAEDTSGTAAKKGAKRDAAGPRQDATRPVEAEVADGRIEPLRGIAGRIVQSMTTSLEIPTATSVRTMPVKALDENRRILNDHMKVRALGKASYTHLIAFALARALRELPRVQARFEVREGRGVRVIPDHVNLGLAIDVQHGEERQLLVPVLRAVEGLDFGAFHRAFEDLVVRTREGKLALEDFQGATATLTNPGGFGTLMSVPRLMKGQGLILATGTIDVPAEARGLARHTLAEIGLGPIMTVTGTYDHRVIQGVESALLLKRLEELLQGDDGFYDEIFAAMRLPWRPVRPDVDQVETDEDALSRRQSRVWELVHAYRQRGCQVADLDPLGYKPDMLDSLDPAWYGFTIWDLDREFLTPDMCGKSKMTGREIIEVLRQSYCRRWTVEYMHITNRERKRWMRYRIEPRRNEELFDREDHIRILEDLFHAENFERFLHTRYVGNKRFSLEGAEVLIPALRQLIDRAACDGVERVVIGMAHRGRLNVLANVLAKSYTQIFREFEGVMLPLSKQGSGDVKYHLGQRGKFLTREGREVEVILSANPSHLEAVDPVVCGMVRGYQDVLEDMDRKRVLGVLIHGDAAISGQGVVAETLNMSGLEAYETGGTIHLVINNQIGFTTGPKDLRSTYYCTDIMKSIEAPVLHANGDYPEAVLRAVNVACDYQRSFGADAAVDIVCYRRWGHNEGDEPAYTQPVLYHKVREHPTVREIYTSLLIRRGDLTREEAEAIGSRFDEDLHRALTEVPESDPEPLPLEEVLETVDFGERDWCDEPSPETGRPEEQLVSIIARCNRMPAEHVTHPNLLRQLRRREAMVQGERDLDWGCAEALAFGSLVEQGVSIRLAGQDSGRGTFSHRHAVIRDQRSGADYVPLGQLAPDRARFEVRDSLLSEEAALAFEYGYAVANPATFALWEAQFGDFANGAQIAIDQFICSSEAKWGQLSGVTLLLPHGYDGQGPEHSNARIGRFLMLCAGGNMTLVNPSSAAQYFHALRRQGLSPEKRPMVLFLPKSLLRDPRAASPIERLTTGRFEEVIDDAVVDAEHVSRAIVCSGKVYHELRGWREEQGRDDVALVRLEQLYPLPRQALGQALERYPGAELVWCQEEPRNMGPWTFLMERFMKLGWEFQYAGRPVSASPATGSYKRHLAEQEYLLKRAFGEV